MIIERLNMSKQLAVCNFEKEAQKDPYVDSHGVLLESLARKERSAFNKHRACVYRRGSLTMST